jgi:hypothetical protein
MEAFHMSYLLTYFFINIILGYLRIIFESLSYGKLFFSYLIILKELNPWNKNLEKPIFVQLRNFSHFLEASSSTEFKNPATGPYPESSESIPLSHTVFPQALF